MSLILGIDPGPKKSAWVLYDSGKKRPISFGLTDNAEVIQVVLGFADYNTIVVMAIEVMQSYMMNVGRDVFETCEWIGRFTQAWGRPYTRLKRTTIKAHLCGTVRAKDSNVRAALIDRFGPTKREAIGLKATPGPLYGVKKDIWSALAVAITYQDTCTGEVTDEKED